MRGKRKSLQAIGVQLQCAGQRAIGDEFTIAFGGEPAFCIPIERGPEFRVAQFELQRLQRTRVRWRDLSARAELEYAGIVPVQLLNAPARASKRRIQRRRDRQRRQLHVNRAGQHLAAIEVRIDPHTRCGDAAGHAQAAFRCEMRGGERTVAAVIADPAKRERGAHTFGLRRLRVHYGSVKSQITAEQFRAHRAKQVQRTVARLPARR